MVPKETVGERVRRYRRSRRLTQEQLADKAGVDRSYLGKIETGAVAEPGLDTMRRIAAALKIGLRAIAEPMGWYEDEMASTDWLSPLRADPRLDDDAKELLERLAQRLAREPGIRPADDPPVIPPFPQRATGS